MNPSILICVNQRDGSYQSCGGSGSQAFADLIRHHLDQHDLNVEINTIKCFGRCARGPILRIAPGGAFFEFFSEKDIPLLIKQLKQLM